MRRHIRIISVIGLMGSWVSAHDSPHHVIEFIDNRIENQGATARLLIDRAYENESLGNWEEVTSDCLAALEMDPDSFFAVHLCADAYLQLGHLDLAEAMARRGLALSNQDFEQAPFHALLAKVFTRKDRLLDAREAWRSALRSPQPEIDWFLGEAESLAKLSLGRERVDALASARARNPSIVLYQAWIQALLDAGDFDTALPEIERGLTTSRWKSSWLLMRGYIHGELQHFAEQRMDATAALEEIQSRLSSTRPDPFLLHESAQALTFLNRLEEAEKLFDQAQSLEVPRG